MDQVADSPAAPAVEKVRLPRKPARHPLEENPPPPVRAWSVEQVEAEHRGLKGRLRQWIKRADAGDPEFHWLKLCVIRIGRSVLIDETKLRDQLHQRTAMRPAPSRRKAAA